MNTELSIAIPTHNRFSILADNLRELLPELVETGVTVHISDSGTDDVTERGMAELQRAWTGIHYRRARPGLPADQNFFSVLGMPSSDYVWLLGDTQRILPGGVKRVLAALRQTPCDFAAVNQVNRGPADLPVGLHRDATAVLERLAWHLTLAGVTIYARQHVTDLETRCGRFLGTNFAQLGIILDPLPTCQRGLLWIGEAWVDNHPRRTSMWAGRDLEIFAGNWADFVLSLDGHYTDESKAIAIRSHSRWTGILEWKALGRLRRRGHLDRELALRYQRQLRLASGVPFPAIMMIARSPRWLARYLATMGRLVSRAAPPPAPGSVRPPGRGGSGRA